MIDLNNEDGNYYVESSERSTRDVRQEEIVTNWLDKKKGTVQAVTGFGKTKVALDVLDNEDYMFDICLIVVPTLYLQKQWREMLLSRGIIDDSIDVTSAECPISVQVINTAVKSDWEVDLLILDEVHNYAADTFYEVFNRVKYRDILGLTAIMERKDGKHSLLSLYCPIIDTVDMQEARKNGYVSPYHVYNLGISLNPEDQKKYDRLNDIFNGTFAKFDHDFNVAMAIATGGKRYVNGFYCHSSSQAANVWSKKTGYSPELINRWARQWAWAMRERKKFLYAYDEKVEAVWELVNEFPVQTIVFSETTEFADRIVKSLGRSICRAYHTNLRTEMRKDPKTGKVSKVGKVRLQREALAMFNDGDIRVLSTAKALDEGFNVEGIELAIIASYTSSKRQNVQRMGRAIRYITGKKAMIVNLYVKGSQEEKWLKDAQGLQPVIYIDNVSQITVKNQVSTVL